VSGETLARTKRRGSRKEGKVGKTQKETLPKLSLGGGGGGRGGRPSIAHHLARDCKMIACSERRPGGVCLKKRGKNGTSAPNRKRGGAKVP